MIKITTVDLLLFALTLPLQILLYALAIASHIGAPSSPEKLDKEYSK